MSSSPCSYFNSNTCRSCALIDQPYKEQLFLKERRLKEVLSQNRIDFSVYAPIVPSDLSLYSRNKAKFVIAGSTQFPLFGFINNNQKAVDISQCPLHDQRLNQIAEITKSLIIKYRINPYNVLEKSGDLKYLLIRVVNNAESLIVRFVVRSKEIVSKLQNLSEELCKIDSRIKIITANIQPTHQAILEGREEILLSGSESVIEELSGFKIQISPQSFSQVTSNVAEKLYKAVATQIKTFQPKLILDLFSGSGCFSIFASNYFETCLGIEISDSAVRDANESAKLNCIKNIRFESKDVLAFLTNFKEDPDLIILNPPRRGLKEEICNELSRIRPKQIIYSSCNSETLATDLKMLKDYEVSLVQPFDMFPMTEHFETLVVCKSIHQF
ncbi:MAG: 23S rRNA (uracil(1939)-C(5))-methyltransferase RlmD [bacterium]|nr:23S rRNA (uracil(1939)-C(5))-methyltransferase RlmD [bacterium]